MLDKALELAALGLPVFPVRLGKDGTKTPLTEHGHLDASTDSAQVREFFRANKNALTGVHVGPADVIVLDVDVKNGKDGWEALDQAWLDIPETFGYDTPTGGRHLVYRAPAGIPLAPSTDYRKMQGVDIRGGSSWVLWNGPVPTSLEEFTPAPEWMLDPTPIKTAEEFEGDVREWFDSLVPGEPNALVRHALSRVNPEMSHGDMVAATYEAIRLGAEQNAGVPTLLAALEEAWLARDPGEHTTPEDRWEYKFQEALASGILKYGAAIQLAHDLPPYSLNLVPPGIPDTLYLGASGDKNSFSRLLAELVNRIADPLVITSVLWNCPTTSGISKDWGLEFVYQRVEEALSRITPLSEFENFTPLTHSERIELLSDVERDFASKERTFIDDFVEASSAKGFVNKTYAVPFGWTCLSMAVGHTAFIPRNGTIGVNLWFNVLGLSGTGKTKEYEFAQSVLDLVFKGEDTYYNLGASSSPEGLHETLLQRDGKPSIILEDEASTFFTNLRSKSWMDSITHYFSDWYTGNVRASNKVRLKELKGKTATTSFNVHFVSTPEKTLRLLDSEMFETGFLARTNWVIADPPINGNERYKSTLADTDEDGIMPESYDLALDLLNLRSDLFDQRIRLDATPEAMARLDKSHLDMDKIASKRDNYDLTEPSVTRLSETAWKCAALHALWRGDDRITLTDVLVSLYYLEEWFTNLFVVAERVTQGDFQRDCLEIVDYMRSQTGPVSRERLMKRFGAMIQRNRGELHDRIDYLIESDSIRQVSDSNKKTAYMVTGD